MEKTASSTYSKILDYINSQKKGTLFISNDFMDFGSNKNIRSTLVRLCESKVLRRIFRGIYIKFDDDIPDVITIAKEICRKNGSTSSVIKEEYFNTTRIITLNTNGSTRAITLNDGCVLKFIHKI